MRELKFRYWNPFANKLVYNPVVFKEGWALEQYFSDRGWTWEQYTGLKDKNGKEIYDGDIIQKFEGGALCVVYWNNEELQWFIEEKLPDCPDGGLLYPLNVLGNDKVVIGNIHENLKLLKEEK